MLAAALLVASIACAVPDTYPRAFVIPEIDVRALALSPDGRRLLVGAAGGARVLDTDTGKSGTAVMAGQDVIDAAFAPDGKRFALLMSGALVVLGPGGGPRWLIEGSEKAALAHLAWCPNGSLAVSVRKTSGSEVHVYAGEALKQAAVLSSASSEGAIACSERGLAIANGLEIEVLDLRDLHRIRLVELPRPSEGAIRLAASANGWVAAFDSFGTLTLFDPTGAVAASRPGLDPAGALAISADAVLVAVGEALLSAPSLEVSARIRGVGFGKGALALSSDGERLFATTRSSVQVARIADLLLPASLPEGAAAEPSSAAFDPASNAVAVGTRDGRVQIFDLEKRGPVRAVEAASSEISALAFLPGKRALLAASGPTLHAFDVQTGRRIRSSRMLELDTVHKISVLPRGKRALFVGSNGAAVADVETLAPIHLHQQAALGDAALSADGSRIAAAVEGRPLVILDAASKSTVRELPEARAAAFDETGAFVASSSGRTILIHRLAYGEKLAEHALAAVSDQLIFAAPGEVAWWSRSGAFGFAGKSPRAGEAPGPIVALAIDRPRDRVITVGKDGAIRVFAASDLQPEFQIAAAIGAPVAALVFSEDGTRLWSKDQDGRVSAFDLKARAEVSVPGAVPTPTRALAIEGGAKKPLLVLLDGTTGPTGPWSGKALPSRADGDPNPSGKRLGETALPAQSAAALAPDGRVLIAGPSGTAWWSPPRAPVPSAKEMTRGAVGLMAVSPDGRRFAQAVGAEVWLRDVAAGDVVGSLVGHEGEISALAWSPKGDWIATGSRGPGEVRIWDAHSGRLAAVWSPRR